ncbi:hypothetical protein Gotur_023343 [Gossypium turneri]
MIAVVFYVGIAKKLSSTCCGIAALRKVFGLKLFTLMIIIFFEVDLEDWMHRNAVIFQQKYDSFEMIVGQAETLTIHISNAAAVESKEESSRTIAIKWKAPSHGWDFDDLLGDFSSNGSYGRSSMVLR